MLDERIEFDEWYDSEDDETTTLYFSAPKSLLSGFFLKSDVRKYRLRATGMEISLEFPFKNVSPDTLIEAEVSPTRKCKGGYEDYDWHSTSFSKDEIEELIKRSGYNERKAAQ